MNIRIVVLLFACSALPTLAQAAGREAIVADRAKLQQMAGTGLTITSNNQEYQILSGVRAAEIKTGEKPSQALTRMGGGKLIETKGSFIVFSAGRQSAASITSVNGTSFPTALNARTGKIGVVPGTLSVTLKHSGKAAAVAASHGLEVVRVFAHLKTAVYRVKPGQDVVAVATSLAADSNVSRAEIEVIEHLNVPN